MTGIVGFSYAQARLQARFGKRVGKSVWLRLHNIRELASYLQIAQQTPLRPWTLGISATHDSHDIELALRQKYRHHVDEVARWLPASWQGSLLWTKRLVDLSILQYLLTAAPPLKWMKSDPDISAFTDADPALRSQAMQGAGCTSLVSAWQQGESLFVGWLSHWNNIRPTTAAYDNGLHQLEQLFYAQLRLHSKQTDISSAMDYEALNRALNRVFRRYPFQPAAVCAYLAGVASDLHRIRSDLMQRLLFQNGEQYSAGFTP